MEPQVLDVPVQNVMRMPRKVHIELTARCNLRCKYCYFFGNEAVEYRDLSTAQWLQFFDELGSLGVMSLVLAGGEPFMRKDLRALLDGVVHSRMRYSLLSNGGLIDDEIAAYLKSTGRCDYVQVSLDGHSPEPHNAARGKGAFEGAVRGIRTLQQNGVNVAVRVTIHRHNVNFLDQIAKFILEDLGLPSFGTNSAGYLGNCRANAEDVMLTTAERQLAMESLLRLKAQYGGRINASAGPLAEGEIWKKMEAARAKGEPQWQRGGRLTGCGCPSSEISVRADGAIIVCSMLAHQVLGQVNRDSLQEVWLNSQALNQHRCRHTIPLSAFEECAGCPYQPYCTGSCPGTAYTLTGQVHHPSPDSCLRRFLADGGTIPE